MKEALKQLDHLFITYHPPDIEYLTGKTVSRGTVIFGMGQAAFFVDSRYRDGCTDLTHFELYDEKLATKRDYLAKLRPKKIAYDPSTISLMNYREIEAYPLVESDLLRRTRAVKTPQELELVRKAARLNAESYSHLVSQLKIGMREGEAAWIFEKYAREHGSEGVSFSPTVAFGKNSAIPHYKGSEGVLKEDMPVLIDVGVFKDRYASDMTRSFYFQGSDPQYQKIYDLVVSAQKEACAQIRPGLPIAEVDRLIRMRFKQEGFEEHFKHASGHGLGLEIHEYPRLWHETNPEMVLEENMAITVEPGLYFPGKWGIRYEDTLIIHKEGVENLYENGNRTR